MTIPKMNSRVPIVTLTAIGIAFFSQALSAAVGKIEFTTSGAYATNAGQQRTLTKGMEINQGDTVVTESGRTQIRFSDGGYISLQPNTEFKVDEYSYEGKTDGSEKGFFSLVKGGLRAITGAVGRVNKNAYRVNTPVATIGIRGTEFLAQFDGRLLVKVGDGAVYMTNASGDLILFKGQVGEVKDSNTKPNYTNDETTMNAGGPKGATPNQVYTENQQQQQQTNTFTVAEQYNEDGTSCVVTGNCPVVESASPGQQLQNQGVAIAGNYSAGSGIDLGAGGPLTVTTDSAGNVIGASSFDGLQAVTLTGTYLDKSASGPLAWQRINNATVSYDGINETYGNLHIIYGALTPEADLMNLSTSLNNGAGYSLIGSTSPTNLLGQTGTLTEATLYVNFSSYQVSSQVAGVIAGNEFYGSGAGTVDSKGIFFTTNYENYYSTGFFSGDKASHAGMSYVINEDIHGAVALIKTSSYPLNTCGNCEVTFIPQ